MYRPGAVPRALPAAGRCGDRDDHGGPDVAGRGSGPGGTSKLLGAARVTARGAARPLAGLDRGRLRR